jgi:hypothetical protein
MQPNSKTTFSAEAAVQQTFGFNSPTDSHSPRCANPTFISSTDPDYGEVMIEHTFRLVDKILFQFTEQNEFANPEDKDWFLKTFENFFHIVQMTRKCTSIQDVIQILSIAYKLQTGKSSVRFITDKCKKIFASELQSSDTAFFLGTVRGLFESTVTIAEHPIISKFIKLYSALIVHGYLERFGITIDDESYSKLETKAMLLNYSSRKSLWVLIADVALTIVERLHEWHLTGDCSSLLHNNHAYELWAKEADRILSLQNYTSNLEAHGTTYFSYIADLKDAIEKGEGFARFTLKSSGTDPTLIKKKLFSLQLIHNCEVTKRAAGKERMAPFGVLVYGTSSVAKSTFSKMLYCYYGKLFGLDVADHFRYVRSPSDEYWSNFDSSKWCIQMDDIAFLLASKSSTVDPTLLELLNVINNVPFVPPQADLADKGKTPVLAKLVVATSNAKDLNAHEYFHCPLAVRRRLPYVIHVEPKKEFLHENGKFIDTSKLYSNENEFPDFWNITISKVKPVIDPSLRHELADLEVVQKYTDVHEFLKDFARSALAHEDIQRKALLNDVNMSEIKICRKCYSLESRCECLNVQADDMPLPPTPMEMIELETFNTTEWMFDDTPYFTIGWEYFTQSCRSLYGVWIVFFLRLSWFQWLLKYRWYRGVVQRWMVDMLPFTQGVALLGYVNERVLNRPKWKLAVGCMTVLAGGVTLYYCAESFYKKDDKPKEKSTPKEGEVPIKVTKPTEIDEFDLQGNVFSTTEDQLLKEKSENVWYNKDIVLTSFDVPKPSASLKTLDRIGIRDHFHRNCIRITSTRVVHGRTITKSLGAVMVKGHYCLANKHLFPEDADDYKISIVQGPISEGLSGNVSMTVKSNDVVRRPDSDFCIIKIQSLPPFKDITKFWGEVPLPSISKALTLRRTLAGSIEFDDAYALDYSPAMYQRDLNLTLNVYFGKVSVDSKDGDCGGLYIATTPRGPIIIGLHILGKERRIGVLSVMKSDIEELICEHQRRFGGVLVVQGGGTPKFSAGSIERSITSPHYRSVFRYIPESKGHLYGSFTGFRASPKSSVCPTPLCDIMLKHLNTTLKYGRPKLSGWELWNKGISPILTPKISYDKTILRRCVDGYVSDILGGLQTGWQADLVTLSNKAAINGLPGVKFIDGVNRNTSMGFPWNCPKKKYIIEEPDEKYPDGINFPSEIWEEVERIEALYSRGKRAFPVFVYHPKDQAEVFRKIKAHKVRLFSSGPLPWSLVVRKQLLSFVRLVQKNHFVFEAAVGLACQSPEWSSVYDYLTHFGNDRMVAGDYGAFDKTMLPDFILAAFEVITAVYRAAGFSEEELLGLMCIGEDIAFPVTDVNGDLFEFFGSNPSGHPLTVIVNSLVNSLYIRYGYHVTNPKKEVSSFKQHVHALTYGDDNAMGVSKHVPWFHHTSLMGALSDINVVYTMADKTSESIPYIDISNVSFLKRSWVFEAAVKGWFCPLEVESVHKSLTMWIPSSTISAEEQMVQVISSAHIEFFFHGREVFEHNRAFFATILAQEPYCFYVKSSTLPSWDEMIERYLRPSEAAQFTTGVEYPADGLIQPDDSDTYF